MGQLEKSVENRLRKACRRRGAMAYKFVSPGRRGVPDRLIVMPGGRCVFVELKQAGETPDPLQREEIKKLRKLGAEVYVAAGAAEVVELIERLFTQEGGAE